ncbi:hypothetical protein M2282_006225 [Variovorax boronicumulans]|uniref:PoNe immunity protein domain-containing protein n=1 Tax=Variovorax boronicumulans TaxID=436515 RepID=UPI002475070C|nr:PoNe immunity protein domain-containing protein [Variovorax boronicumulans]MDH6171039.1 hypothetical protein [Variovorax boronicumulans]
MGFKEARRQRFLSEAHARELDDDLKHRIDGDRRHIAETELVKDAVSDYRWLIATGGLELLILRYTAGHSIEELRTQLSSVIEDFDDFIGSEISPRLQDPSRNEADTLEITQLEAYVYVMWLLSLCKLLGHDALIPKVIGWIDKTHDFNRGRDILFENLMQALTGAHVTTEKVLLHPKPYRPLARATVFEPDQRAALVKEFLETWYKDMAPCYWHGTHTEKEGSSYFGYWAFEAALVTVLWDIDDSSYRDHLVYPKDLVDWAREHRTEAVPSGPSRTPGGGPCPQAGWWFTPALKGSRRYFTQGEVMPNIEGSDYGSTFWQWDVDQTAPKL